MTRCINLTTRIKTAKKFLAHYNELIKNSNSFYEPIVSLKEQIEIILKEIDDARHIQWAEYKPINHAQLEDLQESAHIECRIITSDGRIIQTPNNELAIYDSVTGKLIRKFRGHKEPISYIKELSNGQFITGTNKGGFKIWDPDFKPSNIVFNSSLLDITKVYQPVINACILENKILVTRNFDQPIKLWDLEKNKMVGKIPTPFADSEIIDIIPLQGGKFGIVFPDRIDVYDSDKKQDQNIFTITANPSGTIRHISRPNHNTLVIAVNDYIRTINLDYYDFKEEPNAVASWHYNNESVLTQDGEGCVFSTTSGQVIFYDRFRDKQGFFHQLPNTNQIANYVEYVKETKDNKIIVLDRDDNVYTYGIENKP